MKTILCVPGHRSDMLERARERGADLLLFDLEDAVPAAEKARARELVGAVATPADAVRVNRFDADDVAAVARTGATLWVPKALRVAEVEWYYDRCERPAVLAAIDR